MWNTVHGILLLFFFFFLIASSAMMSASAAARTMKQWWPGVMMLGAPPSSPCSQNELTDFQLNQLHFCCSPPAHRGIFTDPDVRLHTLSTRSYSSVLFSGCFGQWSLQTRRAPLSSSSSILSQLLEELKVRRIKLNCQQFTVYFLSKKCKIAFRKFNRC